MASERAAYAATAQAATKRYPDEQPSKAGDYSAQRQLDQRVPDGRNVSKTVAKPVTTSEKKVS